MIIVNNSRILKKKKIPQLLDSSKISFSDSVFTKLSEHMEGHLLCTANDIIPTSVYSQIADSSQNNSEEESGKAFITDIPHVMSSVSYTVKSLRNITLGKPSKSS